MKDSTDGPEGKGRAQGARTASSAHALRMRADEIARDMRPDIEPQPGPLSPSAAQTVIHDLRVHQIELELQNDELRRAQDSLEGARARYFDLYDLAPVSYFTVSKNGLILEANLAGARLFDVDRTALISRPLSLFILPEDQDILYHATRQLDLLGHAQAFELRVASKEGRQFWVWVEAAVAHDDDGVAVWRIVMTDITYRKAMEQALRAADTLRESWMYYRIPCSSPTAGPRNPTRRSHRSSGRAMRTARGITWARSGRTTRDAVVHPALPQGVGGAQRLLHRLAIRDVRHHD